MFRNIDSVDLLLRFTGSYLVLDLFHEAPAEVGCAVFRDVTLRDGRRGDDGAQKCQSREHLCGGARDQRRGSATMHASGNLIASSQHSRWLAESHRDVQNGVRRKRALEASDLGGGHHEV